MIIDRDLNFPALSGRDNRHPIAAFHICPDRIGIISPVGEQDFRGRTTSFHNRQISLVIGFLPATDFRRYREPGRIGAEMNFCRQATF